MFKKIFYENNINEKKFALLLYLLGYFSLVYGFLTNENSSLGALQDFEHHAKILNDFAKDLSVSFFNYSNIYTTSHSPFFFLLLHLFEEALGNRDLMRFFFLHICLLIPFLFYICLIKQYAQSKKNYLIYIPLLLFFSPYYRSLSIWPGSENLSLIFLILSFLFFLNYKKSKNEKKIIYMTLNILFLALSAYVRPIYCFFSLYFFLFYVRNLNSKYLIFIYILLNIILSFPAFYYVFILDINFFAPLFENSFTLTATVNRICFISSILLFYLIPFLIINYLIYGKKFFLNNFKINNLILSLIVFIPLLIYFNYELVHGGGFFYRLSSFLVGNNIIFYFSVFLALYFIFFILFEDVKNRYYNDSILILIIFLLEIDYYTYQETYDPLLYILFLIFFKTKLTRTFIESKKRYNLLILFTFCFVFYLMSLFRNSISV